MLESKTEAEEPRVEELQATVRSKNVIYAIGKATA